MRPPQYRGGLFGGLSRELAKIDIEIDDLLRGDDVPDDFDAVAQAANAVMLDTLSNDLNRVPA